MKNFFLKRFIYCSPAFAFAIPTLPVMILLPAIYAEEYGLSLAEIGIVLFLAKMIDVISDPLMGLVVDKNLFSRKKWILIGSVLSGVALFNLILPYTTPNAIYLFLWISSLYFGWTIFQVSYLSIGYDLESKYEERSKLSAGREFFVLLGLLASVSFPVLYEGTGIKSEVFLVFLAIVSGIISIFLFVLFLEEKRKVKKYESLEFLKLFKELKANKYLMKLLFPWFINSLANAFPMILFVFFVSSVLDAQSSEKELILFLYFLSAVLGMFFWIYLIKYIEKKDIWRLSMFLSSLIFAFVFFIQSGDIILFSIISCLTGFCLGADMAIPPSIQCDVTDYHKQTFNKDISGILFSLLIFFSKITFAIATLVAFSLLDFFEYDFEDSKSDKSDLLLILMYAGLPIILKLFIVLKLKNFNLSKKKMEKITKNLYG